MGQRLAKHLGHVCDYTTSSDSLRSHKKGTLFFTLYIRLSKEIGVILAPNTKVHTELVQKMKKNISPAVHSYLSPAAEDFYLLPSMAGR